MSDAASPPRDHLTSILEAELAGMLQSADHELEDLELSIRHARSAIASGTERLSGHASRVGQSARSAVHSIMQAHAAAEKLAGAKLGREHPEPR